MDGVDEGVGDAAEAESTGEQGRIGLHIFESSGRGWEDLVDLIAAAGRRERAEEK